MAKKRTRGAQPGNTNAVRHGLYSSRLSAHQRAALAEARELDPAELSEEIALVRARLAVFLEHDRPGQRLDLVLTAARTLAHLAAVHHRLSGQAQQDLAQSVAAVITGVGGLLMPDAFTHEGPHPHELIE